MSDSSLIDMSMADRVAKGAAHMDIAYPGWAQEIDITRLDMQSEEGCIRGQLYGSYYYSLERQGLTDQTAYELGFNIFTGEEVDNWTACTESNNRIDDHNSLRNLWLIEIEARNGSAESA